jgi:bifunctional NMN adenylyltransferase/nudix hydrolase
MANSSGTGIVIGRFQVPLLNDLHRQFIEELIAQHDRVIVILGSNPAISIANPIDYEFRAQMFEAEWGAAVEVADMPDLSDDRIWSQELDRRILEMRPVGQVTIYGTSDGFVTRYSGSHKSVVHDVDDEDMPVLIDSNTPMDFSSFRAGILYATLKRFPTVYPTVDIVVLNDDNTRVLLARKEHETRFRFPGGFTDPDDESFELAAMRELYEECGEITVDDLDYIGSLTIDDWRYRYAPDAVMTHLYVCTYVEGQPTANDDIAEVRWFDLDRLRSDIFVPEHQPLFEMLLEYIQEIGSEE